MRFRTLVLCMLVCIFTFGFSNINTYAAEEGTVVTGKTVTTDLSTDSDITASKITDQAVVNTLSENSAVSTLSAASKITNKASIKTTTKKTSKKIVNYTKSQVRLLSALIYCEANGESYNGKLAVGIVVMNRVRAKAYPDSVKSVIYQRCQFGPVRNGSLSRALAKYDSGRFISSLQKQCIKAAKDALSGTRNITVNGKKKDFSKYLFFSCILKGYTFRLGHHQFK